PRLPSWVPDEVKVVHEKLYELACRSRATLPARSEVANVHMLDPLGSTFALADGPSAVGRMPSQSFAAVPPSVPPSGVPASGVPASAVGPASVVVPASAVVPASPVVPASEELPASAGVPVDPPTTGACDEPHPAPTSIAAAP